MNVNYSKVAATEYYVRSYIVMDYNTGEVLESKDKDLQRSVASISKIMTAIVAIENSSLDSFVEVNDDILRAYGSSIYLKIGEVVTMKDLLYGLMLRSGNDAAVTIARGVSGSVEEFVKLMNEKAIKLGMKNSSFNNPSGLDVDDEGNLSTSYDMALLMKYALNNETFREITSTKEYRSTNHGTWLNKNKLLRQYENTSGGKTGFTTKARRTLVTSAKKGDMELIVVTLDCGGDFAFHKSLYEKYFNNYKTFRLLEEGSNIFEEYELVCANRVNVTLEKNKINKTSIIYKINGDSARVILKQDNEEKNIGFCKASKSVNKHKKKNWFQRLFS
jgi:D-alanyl-D-alanine carboxypeptidase